MTKASFFDKNSMWKSEKKPNFIDFLTLKLASYLYIV